MNRKEGKGVNGYVIGSMIFTMILCSGLFSMLRGQIGRQRIAIEDARGFFMVGIILIAFTLCCIGFYGFPESALAKQHFESAERDAIVVHSILLDVGLVLAALGYGLVGLKGGN